MPQNLSLPRFYVTHHSLNLPAPAQAQQEFQPAKLAEKIIVSLAYSCWPVVQTKLYHDGRKQYYGTEQSAEQTRHLASGFCFNG
jgi:hypothetical protein